MLIIYVVAFIAIFYFMAIRPQQKQRKAHQALLSSLKKGDRILTAAGIYGTVKRLEETVVVVEIARGWRRSSGRCSRDPWASWQRRGGRDRRR
jgi:preprotein translocase subunit YajC